MRDQRGKDEVVKAHSNRPTVVSDYHLDDAPRITQRAL
jgi:hypothetical protein